MIRYSCGPRHLAGCDHGWIVGYARHSAYDDHLNELFTEIKKDLCLSHQPTLNLSNTSMLYNISLIYLFPVDEIVLVIHEL